MVGWWTGFPYWLSVAVIGIGGILGVMYSVPLRRALVTGTDLPYPEGVAAAEVLKVGAGVGGAEENRRGLVLISGSTLVAAALFHPRQDAASSPTPPRRTSASGPAHRGISTSLSMALIGVGHLVGLAVGLAMVVGMVISWVFVVPHWTPRRRRSSPQAGGDLDKLVGAAFKLKARMVGAGTIGVAAIWTLLRIIGPIIAGIRSALAANRERKAGRGDELPITERDIPIGIVAGDDPPFDDPDRAAALRLRQYRADRRRSRRDDRPQHHLHADRRRRDRRGVRLHGRPDRRLEQPDLGRRHPLGARHLADPRGAVPAAPAATRPRRWSPSPCSSPRSSSASRRSPTTTSRTSRPGSWSRRRRGASRSR